MNHNINIVILKKKFFELRKLKDVLHDKKGRPYLMLKVRLNELDFLIPFRSNINHKHSFKTIKNKGLDFSKVLILKDQSDIKQHILLFDDNEYQIINSNFKVIKKRLISYITKYKKALLKPYIKRNKLLIKYSTLKNYHKELNITI